MAYLSNLKLTQKLMLGLSVMGLAMAFIVIAGYGLSERVVGRLNGIYNQANVKTIAGVELAGAYSKDLVGLVDKLNSGSLPWDLGQGRLEEIQNNIESNMKILDHPPLDPDEAQLLLDIENKNLVVDHFISQLRLALQKKDRQGLRLLSRRLHPGVDPLGFRIHLFLRYELGRSQVLVESNQKYFQQAYGWMASLTLAGVLFLSGMVFCHLQRKVSKPLSQLVDQMRHIARGDADLTQRLAVQGRDEVGEMARAFNTFVGKLQNVDEMKTDLIAVTSHQLKTPVAEINGYIDNILMGLVGEVNPRQKEYLEDMRCIGQENFDLISNLLNVSKIDRGVVEVDLQPVGLREVVSAALRDYESTLEQKGLALRLEGLEEDTLVYADRSKMVEVLRNLLNNAIKCTDRGSITVRAKKRWNWEIIKVSDTGIGMGPEILERLFTRNRVLGREAHRSGAGLGLYISKQFMGLQHGDILAASKPGKGSCFTLLVPKFSKLQETAA